MSANVGSRLTTDTQFISDLISGIKKGEIKIPQFQRRFVWTEEQAMRLLDSVANNYPIGSLLLWKTHDKLAIERNIGEFQLPDTDDLTPTDYVLDGQQRLTVIYSCFGAVKGSGGFEAAYDLEKEIFIRSPSTFSSTIFPLRAIYTTTDLLNFRAGLVSHPRAEELQAHLDELIDAVTKYKLPVVMLKDLSVEEVCPIFERINSSGTKLSTYDLMVAATWSPTFDLNSESEKIAVSLSPKGFGDIDGNTVLKCLSAVHHRDIKKPTVLSLRKLEKEEMDALVEKTGQALLHVVDLMKTEFGIYSWDFLPYEAYAIILSVIYADRNALTAEQVRRVREWFWKSSFTERYRGASEHFISKDIATIENFVISGQLEGLTFPTIPSKESLQKTLFRSNNSKSRALILLLSLKRPRNLTNGATVDTENALSSFNKKQFHHIYPKAYLREAEAEMEENSLINICILTASENNRISDGNPNAYLPQLIVDNDHHAAAIFASNLMPAPEEVDYDKLRYAEFLNLRSELIHAEIEKLCAGDRP